MSWYDFFKLWNVCSSYGNCSCCPKKRASKEATKDYDPKRAEEAQKIEEKKWTHLEKPYSGQE